MTTQVFIAILSVLGGFFSSKIWDFFSQLTTSKQKVELKKLQIESSNKEYRESVFKEYEEKFQHILDELTEARQELSKANEKIAKMMGYFDSMTKIAIMHLEDEKPEVAALFKDFSKKINFVS